MKKTIVSIDNGETRMREWRLKAPVNFRLDESEHIAIVGDNGSGKTKLVDMITGKHPVYPDQIRYNFASNEKQLVADNIKCIAFRDSYGSYDNAYYLQQRWNQQEIAENMPTVGELLDEVFHYSGDNTSRRRELRKHLYELFDISYILDKHIILLSSGELRKLQIIKSLLAEPAVLIIDNPFIGLDKDTRSQLATLLQTLSEEHSLQIVLVLTKYCDIPPFITHVYQMKDEILLPKMPYYPDGIATPPVSVSPDEEKRRELLSLPAAETDYNSRIVVQMNKVTIRYGERTILKNLDWIIKNGERWALNGKNGAGKSTLLSLICADNPQSYACDITLFDRKRGTGETIWDIKRHIGYVSPEMHRAYMKDLPAIKIVASGLNDSAGLYVKPKENDYRLCRFWMRMFGIERLAEHTFLKLSSGEQRLVLLSRAFVKDPELLILDEPLHGLDEKNGMMVRHIINAFCERKNKTLIMVSHYEEDYPGCINNSMELLRQN